MKASPTRRRVSIRYSSVAWWNVNPLSTATGTNAAFGDRTSRGPFEHGDHMFRSDRAGSNVVEPTIVGFSHYRVERAHLLHTGQRQHPPHHRVGGPPDTQCTGEQNRSLEFAQFVVLGEPDQLPVAVPDDHRGRDAFEIRILFVGEDRSDAGPDRVTLDYRAVSHPDAGHVRDGIVFARREDARSNPQFPGAPLPGEWNRDRTEENQGEGRQS